MTKEEPKILKYASEETLLLADYLLAEQNEMLAMLEPPPTILQELSRMGKRLNERKRKSYT